MANAATIAACTSNLSQCFIPENTLLQLPSGDSAFAGDVVITEANLTTVSDLFRIFNNLVDTGAGTGLGNMLFLYSADDGGVPDPSTYSVNAVFIVEDPSGLTHYFGNGTDYVLGVPELATFAPVLLALATIIALGHRRMKTAAAITSTAVLFCIPAFSQSPDQPEPARQGKSLNEILNGPPQNTFSVEAFAAPAGLSFYTANYLSLGGRQLPFNIVGADPSLGANTTIIPTVLVPLKFIFPPISGNPAPVLDGTNVIGSIMNSPIFQNAQYMAGPTDLGTTQFGDALQRAEFWNLPGFSTGYHVLLGTPAVANTVTVTVSAGQGSAYQFPDIPLIGIVQTSLMSSTIASQLPNYTANQLPIFVTDAVYLTSSGTMTNCCIFGYHSSQSGAVSTARTWMYAAWAEPGFFNDPNILDVEPLSHETAEWLNDPFVGGSAGINWIPGAVLPGGGACISNFETGDPLESPPAVFTKTTNGTTYHLQDEVLLPWYLHLNPSFSVNGSYMFQNIAPQPLPLVINSPASITGRYADTATLSFAPVTAPVTADVAYIGRGCPTGSLSSGSPADPYLADTRGKIALIDRGACAISLKIDAAANAGAIGVLIGLVAPGDAPSFSFGGGSNFVPSLVITQTTSNRIKSALQFSSVNAAIDPKNVTFSALCGPG
jgi:hypothetical protein